MVPLTLNKKKLYYIRVACVCGRGGVDNSNISYVQVFFTCWESYINSVFIDA